MAVDIRDIKDELVNFLRDNLNSYDTNERISVRTSTKTALATQTLFSLSNNMSYVRSVTIDGTAKTFGTDYSILWRGNDRGGIELSTPMIGGETVVIVWGEKSDEGNFVYPDFPRADLGISTYPRVGFTLRNRPRVAGLGGGLDLPYAHTFTLSIKVLYTGNYTIDEMVHEIRTAIAANCKNFYNFRFISPSDIGEYSITEDASQNILAKIIEFEIPDVYENIAYA